MKYLLACLIPTLLACSNNKTAYIDINQVYASINLSKEYRERLEQLEQHYTYQLSEGQQKLTGYKDNILAKKNPNQKELQEIFLLQQELDSLQKQLEAQFKDSTLYYNDLIEETVNDWVYEFGQEKGFKYIFSPASSNAFMYADSTLDITRQVISYINQEQP